VDIKNPPKGLIQNCFHTSSASFCSSPASRSLETVRGLSKGGFSTDHVRYNAGTRPPRQRTTTDISGISGYYRMAIVPRGKYPITALILGRRSLPSSDATSVPFAAGRRSEACPPTAFRVGPRRCVRLHDELRNGSKDELPNWRLPNPEPSLSLPRVTSPRVQRSRLARSRGCAKPRRPCPGS